MTFALKDGRMVNVEEVDNGKACGCICPQCGEALVARNGGKMMMAHFAHQGETKCTNAVETMLHRLAKEIMAEHKEIMLPAYDAYPGGKMTFDDIQIEKQRDGLQPDCTGLKRGHELWIEFRVTHAVETNKRQYVINHRQGCIEIDLGRFYGKRFTREELCEFLVKDQTDREWIYIRGYYEDRQRAQAEAMENEIRDLDILLSHYPKAHVLSAATCEKCRWHTTRLAAAQLISPILWRQPNLADAILSLPLSKLSRPLVQKGTPPTARIICRPHYMTLRNIYGREKDRNAYTVFRNLLPNLVHSRGMVCENRIHITPNGSILCTSPHLTKESH